MQVWVKEAYDATMGWAGGLMDVVRLKGRARVGQSGTILFAKVEFFLRRFAHGMHARELCIQIFLLF